MAHSDAEGVESSIVENEWVLPVQSHIGGGEGGCDGTVLMGFDVLQGEVACVIPFQCEGDRTWFPQVTIPGSDH